MQRGTLFLVVGPSGAGKDTLLAAARERLEGGGQYVFPRRLITRPADSGGEDHVPVSPARFAALESAGDLMLHWRAHSLDYGIPASAASALEVGLHVVANVSRTVLDEARTRFAPVRVLAVSVPPAVLEARLLARGREQAADVQRRLDRAAAFAVAGRDVTIIQNDGSLAEAVRRFLTALSVCDA